MQMVEADALSRKHIMPILAYPSRIDRQVHQPVRCWNTTKGLGIIFMQCRKREHRIDKSTSATSL
jgi:hypothetical protein